MLENAIMTSAIRIGATTFFIAFIIVTFFDLCDRHDRGYMDWKAYCKHILLAIVFGFAAFIGTLIHGNKGD